MDKKMILKKKEMEVKRCDHKVWKKNTTSGCQNFPIPITPNYKIGHAEKYT